jgi:hypothetical protein
MEEMKRFAATEEGGWYGYPADAEAVPVGEHGMPQRLRYWHEGGDEQPGCVIDIEIWDGAPVCVRAELISKPQIPVRAKDLKTLAGMIDPVIERAGVMLGFSSLGERGWGLASPGSIDEQRARLASVRSSRRRLDNPVFLKEVAEAYNGAPTPKVTAVVKAFDCSERNAYRFITAAREAGLIHE